MEISESKIKEAMEEVGERISYNLVDVLTPYGEGIKTLLDLAQQYLDCKGMPEKKDFRDLEFPNLMDYSKGFYDGFNEALHLCKLAMMKLN